MLQVYNPDEDEIQRRIAAARQAGWKEEDIQRFALVDRMQRQARSQQGATTPQQTQQPGKKNRTGVASWLPTIGSTVGGVLGGFAGSAVPVAGTVAGGAAGSAAGGALGEWLAQRLNHEDTNIGSIAKEGAVSGVLGAIPFGKVAGKLGSRLTGQVAKRGAEDTAENLARRMVTGGAEAAVESTPRRVPVKVVDETFTAKPVQSTASFSGVNPRVGQVQRAYEEMINNGYNPKGIATNVTRTSGKKMSEDAYQTAFSKLQKDYDAEVAAAKTRLKGSTGTMDVSGTQPYNAAGVIPERVALIDRKYETKLADLNKRFGQVDTRTAPEVRMTASKTRLPFQQQGETTTRIVGDPIKELPARAGEEALSAGADEFGHQLADGNVDPQSVALSMATGGAMSRFGVPQRLVGAERRTLAGRALQNLSDETSVRQFRLTKTQLTDFAKKHNEDVSTFLKRHNAVGMDPADVGTKIVEPLQQKFDDAVTKVNAPVSFGEYATAVQRKIDRLMSSPSTADNAVGMNLALELKNAAQKQGANFNNGGDLTKFRRIFDAHVNYTTKQADPAKYTVNKHMADAAREVLEQKSPGIRNIGLELSKAHDFNDAAFGQSQLGRGTNLIRLVPTLMAGAGGAAFGGPGASIPAALATYGLTQGINSRFGQTAITKGLEKAAGFVDNPLVSGISGNLTKQAFGRGVLGASQQGDQMPDLPATNNEQPMQSQLTSGQGGSSDEQVIQQMQAMGITDPQQMVQMMYGGNQGADIASQVGGFSNEPGALPLSRSSAELFNDALQMAVAGNQKGADQAMQMAQFAKQYEDSIYKRMSDNGQGQLSQEQQKRIMGIDSANSLVDQLEQTMGQLEQQGSSGRIGGLIAKGSAAIGSNPIARAYEQQKGIIAFNLAKSLQGTGSQLSDRDVGVINSSIPSLTDTAAERALKIRRLREIIAANKQATLNAPKTYDNASSNYSSDGMDINNAFAYGY